MRSTIYGLGFLGVVAGLWAGCASDGEVDNSAAVTIGVGGGGAGGAIGVGGGTGGGCGEEKCNGLDDDCDEQVDENCNCIDGDTQACYSGDPGTENVGLCVAGEQTCNENGVWNPCEGEVTPVDEQCNGNDDDCDAEIDEGFDTITCGLGICQVTVEECVDGSPQLCVPNDPNPVETCDGLDDDCDGTVDEGCNCVDNTTQACYTGSPNTQNVGLCIDGTQTCANGQWGPCVGDVTPNPEVCDNLDNDCDGNVDNGDPGGGNNCQTGNPGICDAGVWHCVVGQVTCVQTNQPQNEICNGIDEDCDGQIDNGDPGGGGACTTGLPGVCSPGTLHCQNSNLVCTPNQLPQAEQCNGLDDNCDNVIDDGNPGGNQSCSTGQQGVCAAGTTQCTGGAIVCNQNVQPSNEQCNSLDDNCNGNVDEGNPGGGGTCNTGQPGPCAPGLYECQAGSLVCVGNISPATETCNNVDDDCNGTVDNGTNACGGACALSNTPNTACDGGDTDECQEGQWTCQGLNAVNCSDNTGNNIETCNGTDDDCDTFTDEGNPGGGGTCSTGQPGPCGPGTLQCQSGSLQCISNVGPTTETCNSVDDDCNGTVDNGNNACGGACVLSNTPNTACDGQDTDDCKEGQWNCQGLNAVSCGDTTGNSVETCNGNDDDCDTFVDEGNPGGGGTCSTGQPGPCAPGTLQCLTGSLQCVANVGPQTEVCNNVDDDCNGTIDNGTNACGGACPLSSTPNTLCDGMDLDMCMEGVWSCSSLNSVACGDNTGNSVEVCNGADDDCDGFIDEGDPGGGGSCTTGLPGPCSPGVVHCVSGALQCVGNVGPVTETCNNADDDCNGTIDNGNNACGGACALPNQPGPTCDGGDTDQCKEGSFVCQGLNNVVCTDNTGNNVEICNTLDEDCDMNISEGPCSLPNSSSSCVNGVCDITSCNNGFANCDSNDANGCELTNTGWSNNFPGEGLGTYDCDASSGFVCPGEGCDFLLSRTGTRGRFFNINAHEGSSCCAYVSVKFELLVPTGVDYDLYITGNGCQASPGFSATGNGNKIITVWCSDDCANGDNSFTANVEVRWASGSSCTPWTLNVYRRQC